MPIDLAQLRHQRSGEIVAAGKAEKAGKNVECDGLGRQRMGLLVGHHLQPVLDAAQKIVSLRQFVARGGIDPAVGGKHREHGNGAAPAQFAVPPAGDELLGLHEKFDFADAAAAELDVVTLDRDLAMTPIGMDLPLHLVNVGNGRVIEVFSPNEGRKLAQEFFAGGEVAGAGARLDQRRAFPVLAAAFVVIERRLRSDIAIWVEDGSGRSRRSTRKT